MNRAVLLLLCALSAASGAPRNMSNRTRRADLLIFFVTDFWTVDSSSTGAKNKPEDIISDELPSRQSLLDQIFKMLTNKVVFPEEFVQAKKLTNPLQKSWNVDDLINDHLRMFYLVPRTPAEIHVFILYGKEMWRHLPWFGEGMEDCDEGVFKGLWYVVLYRIIPIYVNIIMGMILIWLK